MIWQIISFFFLYKNQSLSYTINGAILCTRGDVIVFAHMFISSKNFLFFRHFYCVLLSYPFLWYKYYFFFLLLVHYLYIKIFSDFWHCVSVCMTKIEQYELNHKEYIYIYIFKETWLNCIFTFQNRFLIIVQFEKLLMDFFEMKHYLPRLKFLRNTVIQYLMSEYYVNTKN